MSPKPYVNYNKMKRFIFKLLAFKRVRSFFFCARGLVRPAMGHHHQLQSDAVTCQLGNYYFSPVFSFLSLFYFPIDLDFSRVVRHSIIIRLNDCACTAYTRRTNYVLDSQSNTFIRFNYAVCFNSCSFNYKLDYNSSGFTVHQ